MCIQCCDDTDSLSTGSYNNLFTFFFLFFIIFPLISHGTLYTDRNLDLCTKKLKLERYLIIVEQLPAREKTRGYANWKKKGRIKNERTSNVFEKRATRRKGMKIISSRDISNLISQIYVSRSLENP